MYDHLFKPVSLGQLNLKNRIFMAPLTRCRGSEGYLANALMAEYYGQRASAGLIVSECVMIEPNTAAFDRLTGIYNQDQVKSWQPVTNAVHKNHGKIVMQIWHAGRAALPELNNGQVSVAPSAIAIDGTAYANGKKVAYTIPRELNVDEILMITNSFGAAAKNAIDAGFDGVEIHAANGYLIDEFLRTSSNKRTDKYGGSIENRARFLFEVIDSVANAVGIGQVGVRISPVNSYNSMEDEDPLALTTYLAKALNTFDLAYLHVIRGDMMDTQYPDIMLPIKEYYKGNVIVNMGYKPAEADEAVNLGAAAVAFGRDFISNPDLPARIAANAPLTPDDPNTYYVGDAEGYTTYPTL